MKLPTRRTVLVFVVLLAARGSAGQAPSAPGRYIVTTTPLSLFDSGPKLCIGVDPTDPTGIWWWEAGRSGCSSRSTGPDVFPAYEGTVTIGSDQTTINIRFRLGMHVGEPLDVRLTSRNGRMFLSGSDVLDPGADVGVPIERRDGLVSPFIALTHSGSAQAAINSRQAWGPVVNGLRMAISLITPAAVPTRGGQFDLMFQNVGDTEVTLNLGVRSDRARFLFPVRMVLTDPQGARRELQFVDREHATITGRLDDLTVRLSPGATHVMRLDLEQYSAPSGTNSPVWAPVGPLGPGHNRITSQFEGVGAQLPHSQPDQHFWIGTLLSGVLDFDVSP